MPKSKDQISIPPSPHERGAGGVRLKLLGSWHLKSIIVTHNNHKIYPFGKHVKVFLVYLPNDNMAVQIMMPRKYPIPDNEKLSFKLEELAQTLKATGYRAYFGLYEIDTHHQRVIHHVESSIAQLIVGGKEVRHYRFADNKMILSSGNM